MNINTNQSKYWKCTIWRTEGFHFRSSVIFDIINDLPLYIGESIRSVDLYAGDTTLYDIGLDKDTLENNLQHSLNLLKMWCLENGMIINIDKTKLILISSRQRENV